MKLTLKLIALLAVVAAVVLPRGTAHDRVMLLVVEGARAEVVKALARAGHLPTLEKVIAGGVGGDITNTAQTAAVDQVLASIISAPTRPDEGSAEPPRPLWDLLARQSRPFALIGLPGVDFADANGALLLPGPDPAKGFIGANTGLVVNRRTIDRGPLPWPYDVVAEGLGAALALGDPAAQWLRWQDSSGGDAREGMFAIYRLDDETVYLTPVYTRVVNAGALDSTLPPRLYVGDDPSRVVISSRAHEYLPRHAADVAESRAAAAIAIVEARPWDLLVYVDRRISIAEAALNPDDAGAADNANENGGGRELAAAIVDDYKAVDELFGRLIEGAGARTAVLVVGLNSQPRARGESVGWFAVASVVGDLGSWGPVSADDLSATLAYLLSFDPGAARAPLGAIAARFPLRSQFGLRALTTERAAVSMRADGRALQELTSAAAKRH